MARSFISNSVSNQDGAKISKSLTKSIQRFYMPSKSVMKFHIMKLKCFIESKKITIFLMNLNRSCNTFRWKMKIIFRTLKRRLKDVFFYWDERTNFERRKDVHLRSRADWAHNYIGNQILQFSFVYHFLSISAPRMEILPLFLCDYHIRSL